MSDHSMRHAKHERGASLLVALIFLVIMAMLGVTVANVTGLQERMAGNTRNRDLALQAAEAAVRDAETRLSNAAFRAGASAYDVSKANSSTYWETCFTATTPAAPCDAKQTPTQSLPTTGPGAVAAQPQFVLERKPDSGSTQIYRITARAVGGTTDSVVIVQAEFGYTP